MRKIVETLQSGNIPVSGVYSPRIMEDGHTIGYDVVDVETDTRVTLLRITEREDLAKIGKYSIFPEGLAMGIGTLTKSKESKSRIVVVDEIGKLELDNHGWAAGVTELVNSSAILIFAVRDTFSDLIVKKWDLKNYSIFKVSDNPYQDVSELIAKQINKE